MRQKLTVLVAVLAVLSVAVGAAAAAPGAADAMDSSPSASAGDCAEDDRGPGADGGPPAFVGDLLGSVLPGFLTDLIASLPVPTFLKSLVGAC